MDKHSSERIQEVGVDSHTAAHSLGMGQVISFSPFPHANLDGQDHFVERNGIKYAGMHLIIDLWGAKYLDDLNIVEQAMRQAVEICGATLLNIYLRQFTPNNGISGVAVLAESHISLHSWPEREYAAFDVFMCGDSQPERSIAVFQAAFKPKTIRVSQHIRGALYESGLQYE